MHCHFFSARFFEALAREKYGPTGTAERGARAMSIGTHAAEVEKSGGMKSAQYIAGERTGTR